MRFFNNHRPRANDLPARRIASMLVAAFGLTLGGCAGSPKAKVPTVSFAFSGDLAGQNACRDAKVGFPIFRQVLNKRPDFFVALGDMIYADNDCLAKGLFGNAQVPRAAGLARDPEDFRAHWDYVRADPAFAELLNAIPYFAVWDDHEVRNDFGPATTDEGIITSSRSVFNALYPTGTDILYFSRQFNEQLELFFLDTRSYRDANALPDLAGKAKTMLGESQKRWLIDSVVASRAKWKVIVTSVPLSIPTGWPPDGPRDGWANFGGPTGYETELAEILSAFARSKVRNLVFISADVHFATGFRYQPFAAYPDFHFHEFVTGPLNAGLFPSRDVDASFRPERLFFHGPDQAQGKLSFEEALRWFNFGLIEIESDGPMRFELIDGYGDTQAQLTLKPD